MFEVGEEFTGEVASLAFGGQGIIRSKGFVIFVPFSAPGDFLRGCITVRKKRFAVGKILEIIQPGATRTTPLCPYFGTCGGCQLQHLNIGSQLDYKKNAVTDALKRIGNISASPVCDVIPSPDPWAYRRHVRLHLRVHHGHFKAGYICVDNHTLLSVRQCPIFSPQSDPIFEQVQTVLGQLHSSVEENKGELTLIKKEEGGHLLAFSFDQIPSNVKEIMEDAVKEYANWAGVLVRYPEGTLSWGETKAKIKIDELQFLFSPYAFIQNHPAQSQNIYREITTIAQRTKPSRILDLYCGIGISTILLARQDFLITGVESNPIAIQLARENAQLNRVSHVRFKQADVGAVLGQLLKNEKPELVIINPPRAGLEKNVINHLLAGAPKEIVYISCMPSTLSRDLEFLCKEKYAIQKIQPYDMFPQTAHVETLVHLSSAK